MKFIEGGVDRKKGHGFIWKKMEEICQRKKNP